MLKTSLMPDWVIHYQRANLVGDVIAGVTVALIMLPQSMAYAQIGGLPPELGLYAAILPLIVYGLLGTSFALSLGPTAVTGVVILTILTPLAAVGTVDYVALTIILVLLSGVIQLVFGGLRLGFLGNLLTPPVLAGFINAAAIVVGMSQIGHLLGIQPGTTYILEPLVYAMSHIDQISLHTLVITVSCLVILHGFKRVLPGLLKRTTWPSLLKSTLPLLAPIVAVLAASLMVLIFRLTEVKMVVVTQTGLPTLAVPPVDLSLWASLLPGALILAAMSFGESILVGKSIANRTGEETIQPNRELIAIGTANIASALSGGMGVSGSLSRSVVNLASGAKTGLASLVTACLMALFLLILVPLFRFIPQAALAAIILLAVIGMFDARLFWTLWRDNRLDWLTMMVTFLAVLILGIERGMALGVLFALGVRLWRTRQ